MPPWLRRFAPTAVVVALTGLGAVLRLWLAITDDGIYWPDEIYQSLEPAHRWLFGYGIVAWEFAAGARNWALPGFCGALLRFITWFSEEPRHYVPALRVVLALFSFLSVVGAYRLARALGAAKEGAALSSILVALAPPALYFSGRALSDTVSATTLVWGFAYALQKEPSRRDLCIGSSLIGLSVLFRMQNGLFALGLLGTLMARKRWRDVGFATIVLVLWAVAYGGLDRLTWGGWFHAAITNLRATLTGAGASAWGVSPPGYYLRTFWTSMPLVTACAFPLALASVVSAPGLLATLAVNLVGLSFTGHKEFRYIYPMVPLWFALSGVGYSFVISRFVSPARHFAAAAVALLAFTSALRFHNLTFGDLGLYEDIRPLDSAYDDSGDVNRLLFAAHDQPDLCGLKIEAVRMAWMGAQTYLHRRVPIYGRNAQGSEGHYNYVITRGHPIGRGDFVATDKKSFLVRIADGCTPDPNYDWALH